LRYHKAALALSYGTPTPPRSADCAGSLLLHNFHAGASFTGLDAMSEGS
jgi:hypothetical protein